MWSMLNNTFGEKVNVMALQEEFWRRTKQPEERIPEFGIHLESIAKKAFSEFLLDGKGEKALEQLIIKRFIAGVAVGNDPMGRYTEFPRLDAWASISRLCVACPASKRAEASF